MENGEVSRRNQFIFFIEHRGYENDVIHLSLIWVERSIDEGRAITIICSSLAGGTCFIIV